MVIIAVPSGGSGGLNELMFSRFGRCPSFTFVNVENKNILTKLQAIFCRNSVTGRYA